MLKITMNNPATLHPPVGPYSQVARVQGSQLVFIAGQTSVDLNGNVVGEGDFWAQCKQVYANVEEALRGGGATWANVVHFTNYLVNPDDLPTLGKFRATFFPQVFPHGYPPNTLLYVHRLLRTEYLLEVQAVAVL
jgi:enamine deaminase RidA (YjgF/YER057c/UK114 family)